MIVKPYDEKTKFLQQGGNLEAAPEMAPETQGAQQDPIMMIAQIFAQGLQEGNCELLAQGASAFLNLLSQASGQGPAPMAGPGEEMGAPVFKRGGTIKYRKGCKKVKK